MDMMQFLEPITYDNIRELHPGEWIWDNKIVERDAHERNLYSEIIKEPMGFRQIDILDLSGFGVFNYRPFFLSNAYKDGAKWEYFEGNRFYRFKRIENMSKETGEEKNKEQKVDTDWLINRFLKEN